LLSLPIFPELTLAQQAHICEALHGLLASEPVSSHAA
jgi:dTDP-4-amino-4,6-dideoxygalactose transaminase